MKYCIKYVTTHKEMDDFVRLPSIIYKENPYYVPEMESDVRDFFRKESNPGLDFSDIQAFVAYDGNGNIVGRVAGMINHKANDIWKTKYVRFGMIEFIDDPEVSALLIDAVEKWGKERGQEKIQGPMGITDFDKEGLLVEDFDKEGSMVTIYNPAYYPQHLEKMGFQKETDWIQVRFDIPEILPERFSRVSKLVKEMYGLYVRKLTLKEINKEGYGLRVFQLFNKAYKPLFGFSELSQRSIQQYIKEYLTLLDLRMMPVVFDGEGNLVAAAITLGSLTHALQKSHGRMWPLGWYHLLKALKFKHEEKVEMLLVAIDPEQQGMGINALIFEDLIQVYNEMGFKWAETAPMLEDNLKVLTQWKPLHPTFYKRRRCYGKEIKG